MKIYFTLISILLVFNVYAINCPIENYLENSQDAEMIFIGKVSDLVGDFVQFRIYEIFKGDQKDEIQVEIPTFFEKLVLDDFWLIYLYKSENGKLGLEPCGGAKNMKNPGGLSSIYAPNPPPECLSEKSFLFWQHINRVIVIQDFQMELSYLGRKKADWKYNDQLPKEMATSSFLKYGLVISNLVLIFVLLWVLRKK